MQAIVVTPGFKLLEAAADGIILHGGNALAAIQHGKLIHAHQLFATMSSDELKKDKHHQRKISFTALVFLYYIIVIKAPT